MAHKGCVDDGRRCGPQGHLHLCYCGVEYLCPFCGTREGYICPTANDDEDGSMCPDCLTKMATEMQAAYEEFQ